MRLIKIFLLTTILVLSLSAREQVNVNFSNLAITDFIKLISKVTNKNILVNHKVTGTVDFVSTAPIYNDELVGILVSVLESKGFTLIRNGSIYEIVRSTEAAKHNAKVVMQGETPNGSLMVTQAIKVKDENVDVVSAKVRYLISKTAKLMTMKESNVLLITDYPKNIETIKQVIKDIDTNNKSVVKIIYVKNTEAKKLQVRLVDIAKSIFNPAVTSQTVKIILDENINGIVVVGNPENVKKIEDLVVKLDVESQVEKEVKIFALKNSDAKAVLVTLNEIVAKQTFSDPALKPNVTASQEINAIIVIGDSLVIKGIGLIVKELDKEKYQVYVQARIINVYKKKTEDLGIKYGFDGAAISSSGGLYSLAANFGGTSITPAAAKLIALPKNLTKGFALGASIDFLEKNDASKSISNPSILCVNNQESSIYVGKTISISTGSISSSVTVGNLTSTFKRKDVGLTLKIKPRVSSKDKVTLEVETILEDIVTKGNPTTGEQPITSKEKVKTQAILRHGESIIIGGLVKTESKDNNYKVPWLGDIPFIGEYLFSSKYVLKEEANLIVVLTPYVIDKSENLSELQKNLGLVAKLQKEYNIQVFENLEKRNLSKENLMPENDVDLMDEIN